MSKVGEGLAGLLVASGEGVPFRRSRRSEDGSGLASALRLLLLELQDILARTLCLLADPFLDNTAPITDGRRINLGSRVARRQTRDGRDADSMTSRGGVGVPWVRVVVWTLRLGNFFRYGHSGW